MVWYPEAAVEPIWPHIQVAGGWCKSITLPCIRGWASHTVLFLHLLEVDKLEVAKSNYHPATSSVSQGLLLFNLFIIILGNGTECTFGMYAHDSKLEGGGVMMESMTTTQIDVAILENWVDMNFLKLIKGKCQDLSLGWNNPMQQYMEPTR